MSVFLILIGFFFLFVDDLVLYQNNRYQLDRTRLACNISLFSMLIACGYFLINRFCLILFPDVELLFDLVVLIALNEYYRLIKPMIKQLVFTSRIFRFIGINGLLLVILLFCLKQFQSYELIVSIMIVMHRYLFYGFAQLAHPLEEKIRYSYVKRAKKKLENYQGIILGITGSYGKTSIKDIITHVCSCRYATCKTPHSYNNQMGISKTILEELSMNHELFVCEMGADHLHEIEDLAHFIQPTMGIVSAIGPQHLSTFKNMDNILHEKLQLLESLPKSGVGFINQDNRYLREYEYHMPCRIVTVGIEYPSDFQAVNIKNHQKGSSFEMIIDEKKYLFQLQLLGENNVLNCCFAIAVAVELRIPMDCVQAVLSSLQPTPHRLELKPFGKGMCIDNAYNSNPDSASCSLKVLSQMPHDRYCITPGFLDLGKDDAFYSFEFGKQLANVCDFVICVGKCEMIHEGLMSKGFPQDHVIHVQSMKSALELVRLRLKEDDICLIENDIPEIFT